MLLGLMLFHHVAEKSIVPLLLLSPCPGFPLIHFSGKVFLPLYDVSQIFLVPINITGD
jgi:hypothetical protein